MPKFIDYKTWSGRKEEAIPLVDPPHGKHEMHIAEIQLRREVLATQWDGLPAQFGVTRESWSRAEIAELAAAHEWLSENTTGPWRWDEKITDDMRELLGVSAYIERYRDQDNFRNQFKGLFHGRELHKSELDMIARSRGVIPYMDKARSFGLWLQENIGYNTTDSILNGECLTIIHFTSPGMENAYNESPLARFKTDKSYPENSRYTHYSISSKARIELHRWLRGNAAIEVTSSPNIRGEGKYVCVTRYAGVKDLFRKAWGENFEISEDGKTFTSLKPPGWGPREIPSDFTAYLEGKVESYAAPFLPDDLVGIGYEEPESPGPGMR